MNLVEALHVVYTLAQRQWAVLGSQGDQEHQEALGVVGRFLEGHGPPQPLSGPLLRELVILMVRTAGPHPGEQLQRTSEIDQVIREFLLPRFQQGKDLDQTLEQVRRG